MHNELVLPYYHDDLFIKHFLLATHFPKS
jgi:hypothetical protein